MVKRQSTPQETETDVLTASGRRCCLCFGLKNDLSEKPGQIAHLDRNPSSNAFDNLAWMCLDHHAEYDGRTSQRKGLTQQEARKYRADLYERIASMRKAPDSWPIGTDVPLLNYSSRLGSTPGIPMPGIQFTDKALQAGDIPVLYLSLYFKRTQYFLQDKFFERQKWLFLEAHMRFAFSLRIQVRAWNERDVEELMLFLRNEKLFGTSVNAYDLQGAHSGLNSADYLHVRREANENRLIMSAFTTTNSAISIHARFSDAVAKAWAEYLEAVGFTEPFGT